VTVNVLQRSPTQRQSGIFPICVTVTVMVSGSLVTLMVSVEVRIGMGLNDVSGPMHLVLVMAGKYLVVVTNMVEVKARVSFTHSSGSGMPYGSSPKMVPWLI